MSSACTAAILGAKGGGGGGRGLVVIKKVKAGAGRVEAGKKK